MSFIHEARIGLMAQFDVNKHAVVNRILNSSEYPPVFDQYARGQFPLYEEALKFFHKQLPRDMRVKDMIAILAVGMTLQYIDYRSGIGARELEIPDNSEVILTFFPNSVHYYSQTKLYTRTDVLVRLDGIEYAAQIHTPDTDRYLERGSHAAGLTTMVEENKYPDRGLVWNSYIDKDSGRPTALFAELVRFLSKVI